ncbi:MAG: hypothetical protein U1E34_14010 [Amaricoccus sp.]
MRSGSIGGVFALLFLVAGPTAIAYVMPNPQLLTADGKLVGGGNMAVLHLATALGGAPFFGVVAGIAFATILAVVAGPTIAAASATSHDLATFALRGRRRTDKAEVRVFRLTTLVVAAISVLLAIAFQAENVAFLAALAFAVATSTNFPVLILALYWRGTTAVGAMAGGFAGLVASAAPIVLGPAVWVKILGYPAPILPSDYPTLVIAPLAFLVAIAVSLASHKAVAPSR